MALKFAWKTVLLDELKIFKALLSDIKKMANNNIVELTPFRADLTRAMARRGERLLASTDLAEEVAALEPLEA